MVLGLAARPALAQSNAPDNPFSGVSRLAKGATSVNDVNLDKDTLNSASGLMGSGNKQMQNMDAVSVHKYGFAAPGMYDMAEVKQYADRLQGHGWKQMVYKQEGGELDEVATREVDGGEMHELAVVKTGPKELDFVYLRYRGSLQGGIPGMDGNAAPDPKLQQRAH